MCSGRIVYGRVVVRGRQGVMGQTTGFPITYKRPGCSLEIYYSALWNNRRQRMLRDKDGSVPSSEGLLLSWPNWPEMHRSHQQVLRVNYTISTSPPSPLWRGYINPLEGGRLSSICCLYFAIRHLALSWWQSLLRFARVAGCRRNLVCR